MVFSSVTFLFYFLPVFFLLYYLLPFRNATLLLASLVFYAWGELDNLWILLVSIAGNYTSGLAISVAQSHGEKGGRALAAGIVINLSVLAYFKYFNLAVATLADFAPLLGLPAPHAGHVPLPLGISFFTFHALSYLVDVYRRKTPVERSLLGLAMYITMFPQLVAGPIIRYSTIAGQIHKRRMTLGRIQLGIQIFIVGLAQKVLIANTVALPADQIFCLTPSALTTATAWLGTVCYTLQIYFDFGGYSNMAIGLGLMTGFTFPRNFNYPYISQSITEFWRRWHITLSRWFRDYLYIPLGGNRKSPLRTYVNLFTVFFLCGLWHGASWTFVFWGMYHGLFLILERAGFETFLAKLWRPFRHLYAMLAVMVGWVFFRSDSLEKAFAVLKAMAGMAPGDPIMTPIDFYLTHSVLTAIVIGCLASAPIGKAFQALLPKKGAFAASKHYAMTDGWCMANSLVFLMLFCLSAISIASGTYNPFIYFRF